MPVTYKLTRYKFGPNASLVEQILFTLSTGPATIQAIIDECQLAGYDGLAAASEIGFLLMDQSIVPRQPTTRLSGSTEVVLAESECAGDANDGTSRTSH